MNCWRMLVSVLLLALSLYATGLFSESDFVQDYAAARGWLMGFDPNSATASLLNTCCAEARSALGTGILQTAHPPFATFIVIPFALLPWNIARYTWLIIGWLSITWAWQRQRIEPSICLATSGFWLIALSLGSFEPLLFGLIAVALVQNKRAPLVCGICIGVITAIKIYPLALIIGLWLGQHRRVAIVAITTGLTVTLITELVLGVGTTAAWLRYAQLNALLQMETPRNLSLTHLIYVSLIHISPTLIGIIIWVTLNLSIMRYLRRSDSIRPVLPIMLLGSPICWDQYFGILGLIELGKPELLMLGFSSCILASVWLHLISGDALAPIGYGPLLIVLALLWYRSMQQSRLSSPLPPFFEDNAVK